MTQTIFILVMLTIVWILVGIGSYLRFRNPKKHLTNLPLSVVEYSDKTFILKIPHWFKSEYVCPLDTKNISNDLFDGTWVITSECCKINISEEVTPKTINIEELLEGNNIQKLEYMESLPKAEVRSTKIVGTFR